MNRLKELFTLEGKIIIITGAVGLLGKKHAEAVACSGGTPILIDLSQKKLDELVIELNEKYKVKSMGFSVDITNEQSVRSNSKFLIEKFGKIDGLVNNAANNPKIEDESDQNFSRLENFTLQVWNQDIAVGLTGSFLCAKHYGVEMSKNPNGGSILNISSDLGLIAPDQRLYVRNGVSIDKQNVKPVSYSVVKTGIIGLTRYLATYWENKNIRCNAICLGGVENGQSQEFIKRISSRIPMGRMATNEEYQGALIWILSSASSYLNGAIIPIDGGRTTL